MNITSSFLYISIPFYKLTNVLDKTLAHLEKPFVAYKQYKVRKELSSLPQHVRDDIGLTIEEIERFVANIR